MEFANWRQAYPWSSSSRLPRISRFIHRRSLNSQVLYGILFQESPSITQNDICDKVPIRYHEQLVNVFFNFIISFWWIIFFHTVYALEASCFLCDD